jgi:hypothetical protein
MTAGRRAEYKAGVVNNSATTFSEFITQEQDLTDSKEN